MPFSRQLQWIVFAAALGSLPLACNKGGGGVASGDRGAQLYAELSCATCHGEAREGKEKLGPALSGLSAHWDSADELSKYLENPRRYIQSDQRLRQRMGSYNMVMPAVPMGEEDRLALARWLLAD